MFVLRDGSATLHHSAILGHIVRRPVVMSYKVLVEQGSHRLFGPPTTVNIGALKLRDTDVRREAVNK